jgi:DEAD/DEAH box helicase
MNSSASSSGAAGGKSGAGNGAAKAGAGASHHRSTSAGKGGSGKPFSKGGAAGGAGGKKKKDYEPVVKITTTKREESEIKILEKRIVEEAPAEGSMEATAAAFTDLPLSRYTLSALDKAKFRTMTQIQRVAIPHALVGRDILGAAKTGSGKTLGEMRF